MTLQKKTNELNSLFKLYKISSDATKLFADLAVQECDKRDALLDKIKKLTKEIEDEKNTVRANN